MQKCRRRLSATPRVKGRAVLAALLAAGAIVCPSQGAEPRVLPDHKPPEAGAHPRLIVRGGKQIEALRAEAATDWGGKVTDRVAQALRIMENLSVSGRNRETLKEAGFKAAGYGAQYLLSGKAQAAEQAREVVVSELIGYPLTGRLRVMDRCSRLQGAALAYDLCYGAWDERTRRKVRAFLREESHVLLEKAGGPDAGAPAEPEHVTVCATVALADMAVLGDAGNAGDRKRIAACEQAILTYLDQSVGEHGFDVHGESVRQAAFASGILPFVLASRLVRGRDLSGHPAVESVLVPMLYQAVPEAGMAVTGRATAATDRSGLFAMATSLTPPPKRPAVGWLFDQLGGGKYRGVVRPHQGLCMLASGLDEITPAPPGEDWPRFVRSDKARFAVFRTGWRGRDDLVAVLYGRTLRILGMGGRWIGRRGRHAAIWSHDPGAGRIDNVFLPNTRLHKTTVYRVRSNHRLGPWHVDQAKATGSVVVRFKGEAKRVKTQVTVKARASDKGQRLSIAPGGTFEGTRVFGVDYTGRCGAPGLFVIADHLRGGGKAPRAWVLHAGPRRPLKVDGRHFTVTAGKTTLRGTVLYPRDATIRVTSNPPVANFLSITTSSQRVEAVMTIQAGPPPEVQATDKGLAGGVQVGPRKLRRQGERVLFGQ